MTRRGDGAGLRFFTHVPLADEEIPLEGGRLTDGVVRVGDTVRRPHKPSSVFVASLLAHFESRRCSWAPRYLGLDGSGRDTFSYIEGFVPEKWQVFSDPQVRDAATLLRELHDATRGSVLADRCSVVCHHDPGPNNTVFLDGRPIAFIDFDQASPGEPLEDLGYMSWSWCVSSKIDRRSVQDQSRQVRIVADSYGLEAHDRRELIDAMLTRQNSNIQLWKCQLDNPVFNRINREKIVEIIEWSKREMAHTHTNRARFFGALCAS